ncbi:response regulator transcription factor [Flavihumibacter petaseus]|uniref:Putative two-component response regulator n=1 Tax=Flavihumibacter petaseus NBRC 106054 TaxID=1220578 RepID=A0A0E9N394_9BACT|nr:response regulator transcription factor [Flavihumibacter petaseus]GAO44268.1 putative two-component response regulator [Flavihumibacter petaseus NBRC 106054]
MIVKVLMYDDNAAIRLSLEVLMQAEPEFELMAIMPNAETVLADIDTFRPDVVLMDIDMPVVNGVEAVRTIHRQYPSLPVIMLTVFDDNDNIFNAICAGAAGYLLKRAVAEEIHGAIRMVLAGGAPMTGSVARKVLHMVPAAKNTAQENTSLSSRETRILQLLVNGYSYKMIAAEEGISIDTVRFHIKKIYEKLQVHSATEAVSKAYKDKLI